MSELDSITEKVLAFNEARGWNPVAEDAAKSIIIEAAELLEHYQWDGGDRKLGTNSKTKDIDKIKAEVADVLWYLITFCQATGIDIEEAFEQKLKHNEIKYPKEEFNGHHNDEFYKKRKAEYRQPQK